MCSARRSPWFSRGGFPIRTSPDRRLYTAPRGFSQCPTSFFGVWRLGIHRAPFLTCSRDAEKSILFALDTLKASKGSRTSLFCASYAIGKVLAVLTARQPWLNRPGEAVRRAAHVPIRRSAHPLTPRDANDPAHRRAALARTCAPLLLLFSSSYQFRLFQSLLSVFTRYFLLSTLYVLLHFHGPGGDEGIRTPGLRRAKAALSHLSYIPSLQG